MDTDDNPRPGAEPSVETGVDWRTQLRPDSRERVVNKITETLKKCIPFSGPEGPAELKKIAGRFEEKIYSAATSQPDYLRKIALKLLTMESKSQKTIPNSLPPNPSGNTTMPLDSGAYHNMQPQVQTQQEPLPMPMAANESEAPQQILSQNIQSDMGSTVSLDSTAQIGHSSGGDWREELHQKIKAMKEMYLPELNEMHQKVVLLLQKHDSLPQPFTTEQLERLKIAKMMLELLTAYLQISKANISPGFQLESFEKQILFYINFNKLKTSVLNMKQNNRAGMQHTKYAETSSSSLDSTAETGQSNGDDWQEEIHQKIKAMKEMYLPELNEMYQEIASKLQMHDSLPQQPKSELLESRALVEHMITLLQVSETNISPSFKDKLGSYEKTIIDYINEYKVRTSIPPQQGQLDQSQMQSHENQINPRIQSMNLPGSVPNMVQNNMIDSTPQTGHSNGKHEQVGKLKLLKNHMQKPEAQVIEFLENQMKPRVQRKRIQSLPKIWENNYLFGVCAILMCLAYLSIHHCKT